MTNGRTCAANGSRRFVRRDPLPPRARKHPLHLLPLLAADLDRSDFVQIPPVGRLDPVELPGAGDRAGDARAPHLRTMAQRLAESTGDQKWFTIATTVEQRMRQAPSERSKINEVALPVEGIEEAPNARPQAVVAVIDTGIDYAHPDLYLNIWINQAEIPAAIPATTRPGCRELRRSRNTWTTTWTLRSASPSAPST